MLQFAMFGVFYYNVQVFKNFWINKMMRNFSSKAITTAIVVAMSSQSFASVIDDYQFSGLHRVTKESLVSLLPPKGQTITDELLAETIRSLYETGQFSDVQASVVDGQVMYQVVERPVIAEVNFDGNRLIPKEGLEQGLKQAGLVKGQVLKQATVYGVETELENQYISQGFYNSDVEVVQTELDGNRVKLDVNFVEGKPAKVVDINIIGNEHFKADDIKEVMALKEKGLNPLSSSSRYAQEKFEASLEAIKALYLNAGFVKFNIENATLNIDEEKNNIFIDLKVNEGERYHFGETKFLGNPTYSNEELSKKIAYKSNTYFSQAKLEETSQALIAKFGDDGHYNAQIRPIQRINEETKLVDIDYYIDPARPVYVRRIIFENNIKTQDEVLRREMRQLEGALASNQKIQLSRARLLRTGFFQDVKVQTKPVANTPDQIDVIFTVDEAKSGNITAAVGYSQSGGVTFQFSSSQSNFRGTGNRLDAEFSRSETREVYNLGVTDPYFTVNGVSQSIGAYYRKTKADSRNISNYVLDAYGANLSYSYPIDENQRLSAGVNIDNTKVRGGRFMGISNVMQLMDDGGVRILYDDGNSSFQKDYTTYNATLGWNYSSLDRPTFPTKGMSHNVDLTLGFGDKNYQKIMYRGNYYRPLLKGTILRTHARLGYGNDLPFYENFYAGGYGSVRGYEMSSLGPQSQAYHYLANGQRTTQGELVGGNAIANAGVELILPLPFKGDWTEQVRPVLFVEGGQVFETSKSLKDKVIDTDIATKLGLPASAIGEKLVTSDKDFRYSAGIGATWYTPIGPLSISYSKPFGNKEGDRTEKVQFQIGSVF